MGGLVDAFVYGLKILWTFLISGHLLCNPISEEKFERLYKLLRLQRGAKVLDIACGKGEFLIRLAELYGISGVGVDISPYCIKDNYKQHFQTFKIICSPRAGNVLS